MVIEIKATQLTDYSSYPSTKGLKGRIRSFYSFSAPEYSDYLRMRGSEEDFPVYNGSMLSIREFYQFVLYFMFKHNIPFGTKINRIDNNDIDKSGNNRGLRKLKTILCLDRIDGVIEKRIGYSSDNTKFALDSDGDICVYVGGNLASDNKVFASLFNDLKEKERLSNYTMHYENDADGKEFIQGEADVSASVSIDTDKIEVAEKANSSSSKSLLERTSEAKQYQPKGGVAKGLFGSMRVEQAAKKFVSTQGVMPREEKQKVKEKKEERESIAKMIATRPRFLRSSMKKGATVEFGHAKNKEGNKDYPVKWIVLDIKEDSALLLSKYVVDISGPYHEEGLWEDESKDWENCTLRHWMNTDFIKASFTTEESSIIKPTICVNDSGISTKDRVFLLSIPEIEEYYPYMEDRKSEPDPELGIVYDRTDFRYYSVRCWGTRSGKRIDSKGDVVVEYNKEPSFLFDKIRPAMWIKVDIDNNSSKRRLSLKQPSSFIYINEGLVRTVPYRGCYQVGDYYYSYGKSESDNSKIDICRMNLKTGEENRLITLKNMRLGYLQCAADDSYCLPLMDIYKNKIFFVYQKDRDSYETYIGCMNLDGSNVHLLTKRISDITGLICGDSGIVFQKGREYCLISYNGDILNKVSSSKRVVSAYGSRLVFEQGTIVDLSTMEKNRVEEEYPAVKGKSLAMIDLANEIVYYYEKKIGERYKEKGFSEFYVSKKLDNVLVGVNRSGEEVDRWDISLITNYRKTDLANKNEYDRCTYAFNGQRLTQKLSAIINETGNADHEITYKPTIFEYDRVGHKTVLWKEKPEDRRSLEAYHYMTGDTITFLITRWPGVICHVGVLTHEGKIFNFRRLQ